MLTLVFNHEIHFSSNPRKHEVLVINLNCLIYRCFAIEVALVFAERSITSFIVKFLKKEQHEASCRFVHCWTSSYRRLWFDAKDFQEMPRIWSYFSDL